MSETHTNTEQTSQAVKRLMDQYTEIARLAGALAHEIKNPLSTIRLNMELLAEDMEETQSPTQRRAQKRIESMQRECQRLQDLLDDFLQYAKVRHLDLRPVDLNKEIDEALDFFQPEAAEASVEIIRYLDPELPSVLMDREAFRGAFFNLILNAKQAMPSGGQLMVRTGCTNNGVAIYLIDTGVGMDEQTAAQMFDAFFSTKPGGTGLGLPTTAKVIDAHHGTITVQSEVGRGTQITIELPVPARLAHETRVVGLVPSTMVDSPMAD